VTTFKQKLRAGEPAVLVNPDHPSASVVARLAGLGVDAVMIDCEQGSPGFVDVEHMTRAARVAGLSALVRIPSAVPWIVERYLMRDIDGVVVPRLDSGAQAAAVVDEVRYCTPRDFDRKTIVVQLESTAAVEDLDAFLAVEEIDSFFIGAVDLSKSMGWRGDYSRPEVLDVVERTIARIVERGRSAGMLVKEGDIARWRAAGVTLLYGHVDEFVRIGAREWRRAAGLDEAGELL
jgi:2-keto-3-deoxy-L-rhamnonate aldolase RhmA